MGERWRVDGKLHVEYEETLTDIGQDIVGVFLAEHVPAIVPCNDLVRARRNVGEFKTARLVRDRIVRMNHDHHFCIHPDVAAV